MSFTFQLIKGYTNKLLDKIIRKSVRAITNRLQITYKNKLSTVQSRPTSVIKKKQ
jgi:hypothetical protein